jgi:hypothetical protein
LSLAPQRITAEAALEEGQRALGGAAHLDREASTAPAGQRPSPGVV